MSCLLDIVLCISFEALYFDREQKYTITETEKKLCFRSIGKVILPVASINYKELHRLSTSGQQVGPVSKANFLEIFLKSFNRSLHHEFALWQFGAWILWLLVKAVFLQNNIFSSVIKAPVTQPPLELQDFVISPTLLNPPLPRCKIKTIITR